MNLPLFLFPQYCVRHIFFGSYFLKFIVVTQIISVAIFSNTLSHYLSMKRHLTQRSSAQRPVTDDEITKAAEGMIAISSPLKHYPTKKVSTLDSDGVGMFSPGFTLFSPIADMAPPMSSYVPITPSMFDPMTQSHCYEQMETDFFQTFQITTISNGISSLLTAIDVVKNNQEEEINENDETNLDTTYDMEDDEDDEDYQETAVTKESSKVSAPARTKALTSNTFTSPTPALQKSRTSKSKQVRRLLHIEHILH
jgi:hypothetical protein